MIWKAKVSWHPPISGILEPPLVGGDWRIWDPFTIEPHLVVYFTKRIVSLLSIIIIYCPSFYYLYLIYTSIDVLGNSTCLLLTAFSGSWVKDKMFFCLYNIYIYICFYWLKFSKPWVRASNEAVAADVFVQRYAAGHTSSTLLQAISCEYSTLRLPSFGASRDGTCTGTEALQSYKHSRCLCRSIGSCRLPGVDGCILPKIKIAPWRDAILTPSFQVLCLASGSIWESWKYSCSSAPLNSTLPKILLQSVIVLGKNEDYSGLAEISKNLVGWNALSSPIPFHQFQVSLGKNLCR